MAITPVITTPAGVRNPQFVGQERVVTKTITTGASDTYVAGGFAIAPSDFGLTSINRMSFDGPFMDASFNTFVPKYNPATGKIVLAYGDNNNASDGPLIEATGNVFTYAANATAYGR